ncbi:MAG: hypothetical protein AB7K09_09330 [Planctomycetota bacterium]
MSTACSSAPTPIATTDNTPAPQAPPPTRRIILTVGVDQYQSPLIPPNLAATLDASAVGDALARGSDSVVRRSLTDAQATTAGVTAALQEIAALTSERFDDTVIVYIASCGAPVSMPSGARSPVGPTRLFVALTDADPANLRESALSLDALNVLWKCKAERVVVFLDCAFGRESRSVGLERIDPAHVQNLVEIHTADISSGPYPARALVFGTDFNLPLRTDVQGRSTFATTLAEALGGAADGNHDKHVTLQEAVTFVIEQSNAAGSAVNPVRVIADLSSGSAVLAGPDTP